MMQNHQWAGARYDRLTINTSEFQAWEDVKVTANLKICLEKKMQVEKKPNPWTEHICNSLPLCPQPAAISGTAGNTRQKQGVQQPQDTAFPTHLWLPVGWPPYKARENPCSSLQSLKETWTGLKWPGHDRGRKRNTVLTWATLPF